MDAGRIIADGNPRDVMADQAVIEAYLGGGARTNERRQRAGICPDRNRLHHRRTGYQSRDRGRRPCHLHAGGANRSGGPLRGVVATTDYRGLFRALGGPNERPDVMMAWVNQIIQHCVHRRMPDWGETTDGLRLRWQPSALLL